MPQWRHAYNCCGISWKQYSVKRNYSVIKLEYTTFLLALAKRHMSNIYNVVLHASMTPPMHIFVT